ncbi:ethanolamine ammonia-lyase reactivating factor EutA, partial [Listeria monocytogenes]|nr:ethanolamine ammonia-lyase reactivating factor EutA [Listeria monocytogenes]
MTETILSVGIDLGTSTTQLILSELEIQNMASSFT